ncbi:NAD(P)/FAD-dependent oxidoreductase [Micromonospora sp. C51]|uniref:flavin-containing monooxygenase n=1 Tax=Micromonospora sp. C51 TaxID=2824879 RepID=UPI001B38F7F8|nr:NAD(P)/FAD-dependent oxidoreductase [Micromonospora sp. C51]MBQ1048924.1 NAD(P)/FAD-dependent oxidoreductase [Micromonospora sp. C51]
MTPQVEPVIIVGGGQSGLAAARAALAAGLRPVVLHAGNLPVGSWPDYYDSLTLFSPTRFSAMPGMAFDGDPDHYPHRDEVVTYLHRYAGALDAEIRTGVRVAEVQARSGDGYLVRTDADDQIAAAGIIAASGSFGNPYLPELPGRSDFTGDVAHVANYRRPDPYAGQRVIVVGAGNSAVQVAYELAAHARVTLATREPVRFLPQRVGGRDLHHWLRITGADRLPRRILTRLVQHAAVLDTGVYHQAITSGQLARREMFSAFTPDGVIWGDGTTEHVDTVIFATGYRPDLGYLEPLGALAHGTPRQVGGLSTTHRRLAYLGLEFQRSFASNTLRGVGRDAAHVVRAIAGQLAGTHKRPRSAHTPPAAPSGTGATTR